MIDHVSIGVSDLAASTAFYDRILAPLGYTRLVTREKTVGYGKKYPEIWLNHRPGLSLPPDSGTHICLRARGPEPIQEFYRLAMELGAEDDGAPGPRQELGAMTDTYYAAFIFDADRNKIEAVTF